MSQDIRALGAGDSDFDPIRDQPGFRELLRDADEPADHVP